MRVKDNLSSITNAIGKKSKISFQSNQIGRVYGIVTTENTPTKTQFERAGGWNGIGTIFYLDYLNSKDVKGDISDTFFNTCRLARPLNPQLQQFPLLGELVYLEDLPSPATQLSNTAFLKYYISTINLWNNNQQNSQPASDNDNLGLTFVENSNVRSLIPFEGDFIVQSRQGSSLRFTTTSRGINPSNEWSQVGDEIDPITILTNGLDYDPSKQYYIERINKDASSIYLTSTQKIPLQPNKTGILNNLTNPLNITDYTNSQIILNGDRIILNSKKDEVMLFATTNIELNTKNTINLNADARVHLNSNSVFLGPYDPNNLPQPVLLGTETVKLFYHLIRSLSALAGELSKTVGVPEGSPIINLNTAGSELLDDLDKALDLLKKIPSRKIFLAPDNAIQTNNETPAATGEEFKIVQASFTPTPAPEPISGSEIQRELITVSVVDFEFTFNKGVVVFEKDKLPEVNKKIDEVVQIINQNKKYIINPREDILIEIEGGESQVTNPFISGSNPPRRYPPGGLAEARANTLQETLHQELPKALKGLNPPSRILPTVIGSTKYDRNSDDPDNIRYTREQYVRAIIKVKREVIPFNCNFSDKTSGGVAKKENNFLFRESEIIDLTGAKNNTTVKITFNPYTFPDLLIIETNLGILYNNFVGQQFYGDLDLNVTLATALGNAYEFYNKIPFPFPQDISPLSTPPEKNKIGNNIYISKPTRPLPGAENKLQIVKNVFKIGGAKIIENIVDINKLEPSPFFIPPEERIQYWQFNKNQIDSDWDPNKGKIISFKKTKEIFWVKYKIYSVLNNTVWDLNISCEEPTSRTV